MQINVIGTIFGQSGYDQHTRALSNALFDEGLDVRLDIPKLQGWEQQVNDKELEMLNKNPDENNITIAITQPQFWPLALANNPKHFIGFLVWEGDKIPDYWLEIINDKRIDMIFVPSQHTKEAITESIIKWTHDNPKEITPTDLIDKIKIVPHGVDIDLFKPEQDKDTENLVFLMNKGWSNGDWDRGGIQYGIKAFAEEFTAEDKIELRIKVNTSYCQQGWNFQNEVDKLNISNKNKPKMLINLDMVPYKNIPKFYNSGDVFLSPTRADAFGLPSLEAISCGLPVIQTNYGGQLDFIDSENGWLIGHKLEKVTQDIMYEEVQWAVPEISILRSCMRHIYENQQEIIKKCLNARSTAEKFTWQKSAKKIKELIASL